MSTAAAIGERNHELKLVEAELAAGRGVLLVGEAGIGKSYVARTIAARWSDKGGCAVRTVASVGAAELPLGAFTGLLGHRDAPLMSLFAEVRNRLLELAADRPLLLVVDDVPLLDESSMALIHQFVAEGQALLVTTMRSGVYPPAEITDLAQRGDLRRIEIAALGVDGIDLLAGRLLGASLDPTTLEQLSALTQGNPLYVRELLLAAREGGHVEVCGAVAEITHLPTGARRLTDLLRERLGHLSPQFRAALTSLAFAEPCGPGELAGVADLAALSELEAAGLIVAEPDGLRLRLRLAHPLYGEVLRQSPGLLQRRTILAGLARDLHATGARRRGDTMKLARLAVDGGVEVDLGLLQRASAIAIHAGHLDLAERIGRRLMERDPGFVAGWDLASALLFSGDLPTLSTHLAAWQERASSPGEHRAVALTRAQAQFWLAGDAAAAHATSQEVLDAFPAEADDGLPMSAAEVLVNQVYMPMPLVDPTPALHVTSRFHDDPRLHVRIRALRASASACGLIGRFDDAVLHIDAAIAAHEVLGSENISTLRVGMEAIQSVAHLFAGRLQRAAEMAQRMLSDGSNDAAFAFGASTLGLVWGLQGRPRSGLAMLESQAFRWELAPGVLQRRWLLPFRAWLQAASGRWDGTRATLAEFDDNHSLARSYDMFAVSARIRLLSAEGRFGEAERVADHAIERFAGLGQRAAEAMCHHELIRLGIVRTAPRLAALASECDGVLIDAWAAHGTALARSNGEQLAEAAEAFSSLGLTAFAAEAATQAADAFRRALDQRSANRLTNRAAEWKAAGDEAVINSPLTEASPVPLTRREREIAVLAAQGIASREIGERLFISRRTAENHLAKVYDKLGVSSRSELAQLLATTLASQAT